MKTFIVKVPGLAPYTALARSSCDAIEAALYIHGGRAASAKPA